MKKRKILDTDVASDYLKNIPAAVEFIDGSEEGLVISAASIAELCAAGETFCRRLDVPGFLRTFEVIGIGLDEAELGGIWFAKYGPSHGSDMMDCLIAATASVHGLQVITRNRRHFPMLEDVLVPYTL